MATFEQLYTSLLSGVFVLFICINLFGLVIRWGFNEHVVPRTWSRPKDVVKNVMKSEGNYFYLWYIWALKVSYPTMLDGIPGTGTRNNGWAGPMLRCNLDGIVMLKFHVLLFKVTMLATFLCMLIIFPVNISAYCDPFVLGFGTCLPLENLTNYETSTIAHIPPYEFNPINSTVTLPAPDPIEEGEGEGVDDALTYEDLQQLVYSPGITNPAYRRIEGLGWRYFAIVFVAMNIYMYTCVLVRREWIDNVALRRVYYLEHDHYGERLEELEGIVALNAEHTEEDPYQATRPPWMPHPELRETVPSIELYSALYKLPTKFSSRLDGLPNNASDLDRQLAATVEFFDECVPNQPGYSSSVAAVTILPEAKYINSAWIKWYIAAKRLRKLRYIRKVLKAKIERHRQNDDDDEIFVDEETTGEAEKHSSPLVAEQPAQKTEEMKMETNDTIKPEEFPNDDSLVKSNDSGINAPDEGVPKIANPNNPDKEASEIPNDSQTLLEAEEEVEIVPRLPTDTDETNDGVVEKANCNSPNASFNMVGDNVIEPAIVVSPGGTIATELQIGENGVEHSLAMETKDESAPATIEEESSKTETEPLLADDKESNNQNRTTPDIESNDKNDNNDLIGLQQSAIEPSTVVPPGGNDGTIERNLTSEKESLPPLKDDVIEVDKNDGKIMGIVEDADQEVEDEEEMRFLYSHFDAPEYAKMVGIVQDAELDEHFTTFGIEQLSVYAREFAQNSSNACPYGFAHNAIKFSSLKRLQHMEEKAVEALRRANKELAETQAAVLKKVSGVCAEESDSDSKSDDDEFEVDRGLPDIENGFQGTSARQDSGLRKRSTRSSKWTEAKRIARSIRQKPGIRAKNKIAIKAVVKKSKETMDKNVKKMKRNTKRAVSLLDHPTYAVVTFTSRQAALAARQCLTDGGGLDRWSRIDELPVMPLADAPPRNIFFCRGFCRPVTLTINDNEKQCRTISANFFFVIFSLLYTVPLALTSQILNPTQLAIWFPDYEPFQNPDSFFFRFLSGLSSGMLYSLFFSFCPQLFKGIANFKGNASSMAVAEGNALQYYWIFMLLTAFTGSSLANMVATMLRGVGAGDAIKEVFRDVAKAIPTEQAPVWTNWIIVRFTYTLPFFYLCQANSFLYAIMRWPWMSRVMKGGGPGGHQPYRIYIDSGTVLLCVIALGPACPVITPFAFLYFCVMIPLLRWLLIFVYRPKFDGGGEKWPFLHEMIISALIVSQLLLCVMLFLKYAYFASFAVFFCIFPTYEFGKRMKSDFLRQFRDAGLLQTSRLDGWDTSKSTSQLKREEYRRWLVDCHKASYVPVCLLSSENILTAEPCVVVPTDRDEKDRDGNVRRMLLSKQATQRGAFFRRNLATDNVEEKKSLVDLEKAEF